MFTFGSDPEFMLVRNGQFISAIGVVPGSRERRFTKNGHQFYYDNVLAECAIKPAKTKNEAVNNIREALKTYAEILGPNIRLLAQASQNFPKSELLHKDALKAGCSHEQCAYTLDICIKPPLEEIKTGNLRSAGGHIHLGSKMLQGSLQCIFAARMLDLFLGVPSIFIDHDETSRIRKQLWGQAGRYRRPKHGLEYRSIGNFWLGSPELVKLIYDICEFVVKFVEDEKHFNFWNLDMERLLKAESDLVVASCHTCHAYDVNELRFAIDTMDKRKGKKFLTFIQDLLPSKIQDEVLKAMETEIYDLQASWRI